MSLWYNIRKDRGITVAEFARKTGYDASNICHFEKGDKPMPMKLQIEYLKLRNTEEDKIIIKYLEERVKENV